MFSIIKLNQLLIPISNRKQKLFFAASCLSESSKEESKSRSFRKCHWSDVQVCLKETDLLLSNVIQINN